MPSDTGAPFFLPYPEDTDLVREGADDIEALAVATAAGLLAAGSDDASDLTTGTLANARLAAGTIIQVLQTVKLDTFTTTSTTFVDIPGLTVTITPSSTSSKILVLVDLKINGRINLVMAQARLIRGSTVIYVGNAAGNRAQVSGSAIGGGEALSSVSPTFLDSPNTTGATTYKMQLRGNTANFIHVNKADIDPDEAIRRREPSSITLFEVKG